MQKEISLVKYLIVLLLLVFIECFIMCYIIPKINYHEAEKMCVDSVCNGDKTICYKYDLDSDGNTKVVWKGNCSHLK